jgi:hypothetical protein
MVGLASVLPAHDGGAVAPAYATDGAIALLFFLHGAQLAPQAAMAGGWHWRLHVVVIGSTFVLFPALGLGARARDASTMKSPDLAHKRRSLGCPLHQRAAAVLRIDLAAEVGENGAGPRWPVQRSGA